MITPPAGWTVERVEDGLLVCPPEGPRQALFHYVERRRPLRRAIELVRAAQVPLGFVQTAITAPRRLTTIEGEYAALVMRSGTLDAAAVALVYGYVFLDDYYAALEGIGFGDPRAMVETIEQMLIGDIHLLGRHRRRRYLYASPTGWQGVGTTFEARWYPLDYPANPARIFVNPALPNTPGLTRAILDKLGGAVLVDKLTTRHGLGVEVHELRDVDAHVFFLTDDDFLYSVRADGVLEIGRALVDSIEPVPRPQHAAVDAVQFWAD